MIILNHSLSGDGNRFAISAWDYNSGDITIKLYQYSPTSGWVFLGNPITTISNPRYVPLAINANCDRICLTTIDYTFGFYGYPTSYSLNVNVAQIHSLEISATVTNTSNVPLYIGTDIPSSLLIPIPEKVLSIGVYTATAVLNGQSLDVINLTVATDTLSLTTSGPVISTLLTNQTLPIDLVINSAELSFKPLEGLNPVGSTEVNGNRRVVFNSFTYNAAPTPVICFHPDSRLKLSNGSYKNVAELTDQDTLSSENMIPLVVSKIKAFPSTDTFWKTGNAMITDNHLVKLVGSRANDYRSIKMAKRAELKAITLDQPIPTYHVIVKGPRDHYFVIPDKPDKWLVEVMGEGHKLTNA